LYATVACMALLTACTGPVAVPEHAPDDASREACSALMADLPAEVLGKKRRAVEPGQFAAAWGDPPLVLRCGVAKPPKLGPSSPCYEVNDVGWFAEEASGGYLFTTIGRMAYVEVAVPAAYAPEANVLVDLADSVRRHDPQQRPCR
jgi:hypothetical protein